MRVCLLSVCVCMCVLALLVFCVERHPVPLPDLSSVLLLVSFIMGVRLKDKVQLLWTLKQVFHDFIKKSAYEHTVYSAAQESAYTHK